MRSINKKVMLMVFAAMMTVGSSAFAITPVGVYSENGDHEAVVNTNVAFTTQEEHRGYSENGTYKAVINTDVPQMTTHFGVHSGYTENGDYRVA